MNRPAAFVATFAFAVPLSVAADEAAYRVCVSNEKAGTASVIDGATREVVSTIPVGKRPWGIGLSPDGSLHFVVNGPSDDVSVVDQNSDGDRSLRVSCGRVAVGASHRRL